MSQNHHNAVILTGHSTGVVNMWTPNFSDPVASILTHPNIVNNISADLSGNYLVTTGTDSKMRVWDIRTYKQLYEYFNPLVASSIDISQKGLLSVSYGNIVEVWKDYQKTKQKEPYMKHHFKNNQTRTKNLKFIGFEDFLGVGTNMGYSSLVIPGSGEANFDTFENNPFQTKNQRQTAEVKMLLEKIPANMITLDPNSVNKIDSRSKAILKKEKEEELRERSERIMKDQKKKNKMRLSNKESKIIKFQYFLIILLKLLKITKKFNLY
jgi:U3 small nucleolar RNA-associated protein 7